MAWPIYAFNFMKIFFLKNDTTIQKFEIDELLFITCDDHCLSFHSTDNVFHKIGSICDVLEELPNYFFLINRNTVINLKHIEKIELSKRKIFLNNKTCHSISVRKLHSLTKALALSDNKFRIYTLNDDFDTLTNNN